MPLSRIYQAETLAVGMSLMLDARATHYLSHVLRARLGDELILFNGQGGEYLAVIKEMHRKGILVELGTFCNRQTDPRLVIFLAQGIARGEKMDFILQKAVEIGVSQILPLVTERCNVRIERERQEKRLQHWRAIVISACEQSGRTRLPDVAAPQSLAEGISMLTSDLRLVLTPHAEQKTVLPDRYPGLQHITLLVGPEGGLSVAEVNIATAAGFLPWNLGPRILRTETAALVAASILQYKYGDL